LCITNNIIKNRPCGIEYEWFNKHQHFKDIEHGKINCGCGSEYSLQQQHRHFRTNKHLIWLGEEPENTCCRCGGKHYHNDCYDKKFLV
jgi:hypothetical protein